MPRFFCIGDIHGCSNTLSHLLTNTIQLKRTDSLLFIGDYIDRGPDSKGVIDIILDLYKKKYDVTCLLGNHEDLFMESDQDAELFLHWFQHCGGFQTLKSFNVASFSELAEEYKYFFRSLLHYKTIQKKYITVHAALNMREKNIFSDKYTLLWGRDQIVDRKKLKGRIIIHGHTPQSVKNTLDQIKNMNEHPVVNIDNGCVYKNSESHGLLSAFELTTHKLYSTKNQFD